MESYSGNLMKCKSLVNISNEDLTFSFIGYPLPTWACCPFWVTLKPDNRESEKCKVMEYKHLDKVIAENQ